MSHHVTAAFIRALLRVMDEEQVKAMIEHNQQRSENGKEPGETSTEEP